MNSPASEHSYKNKKVMFVAKHFPAVSQTFIITQISDIIKRGFRVNILSWYRSNDNVVHPEVIDSKLLEKTSYAPALSGNIREKIKLFFGSWKWDIRYIKLLFALMSLKTFGWSQLVPLRRFIFAVFFIEQVNKEQPDIIHIHFGDNALIPVCILKSGLLRYGKIMVTFHGYDLHNIRKGTYDTLFKLVDVYTVNSNYSKNELIKLGCPANKIRLLPVGLDCSVFNLAGKKIKKDKTIRLLYVGRLVINKGILSALDAYKRICSSIKEDIYFDIVGDGELMPEVISYIKRNKLKNKVILHGSLASDKIIELMQSDDIFLFPGITAPNGRKENQGLVIQEAQAMELPVIVSDVGGVPEGVVDGKTGFVVTEGDINSIVDKLKQLMDDDILRKSMGQQGRQYVMGKFDIKIIGKHLVDVYEELLIEK